MKLAEKRRIPEKQLHLNQFCERQEGSFITALESLAKQCIAGGNTTAMVHMIKSLELHLMIVLSNCAASAILKDITMHLNMLVSTE